LAKFEILIFLAFLTKNFIVPFFYPFFQNFYEAQKYNTRTLLPHKQYKKITTKKNGPGSQKKIANTTN
jgi:hypothetical protein